MAAATEGRGQHETRLTATPLFMQPCPSPFPPHRTMVAFWNSYAPPMPCLRGLLTPSRCQPPLPPLASLTDARAKDPSVRVRCNSGNKRTAHTVGAGGYHG